MRRWVDGSLNGFRRLRIKCLTWTWTRGQGNDRESIGFQSVIVSDVWSERKEIERTMIVLSDYCRRDWCSRGKVRERRDVLSKTYGNVS